MATPVFVIGPARNGTTITERMVRSAPDVSDARYTPGPRWDFVAIMELGGDLREQPMLDGMARFFANSADQHRYRLVKLALPLAHVSFAWPKLLYLYPNAQFVLVRRNWYDAYLSVCKMPHIVNAVGQQPIKQLYHIWHNAVGLQFSQVAVTDSPRVVRVDYDLLVEDADTETARLWDLLCVDPPAGLQAMMHKPRHWHEAE